MNFRHGSRSRKPSGARTSRPCRPTSSKPASPHWKRKSSAHAKRCAPAQRQKTPPTPSSSADFAIAINVNDGGARAAVTIKAVCFIQRFAESDSNCYVGSSGEKGQHRRMSAELPDDDSLKGMSLNSFTASALFERTFDEGMGLVEECARYLDGRGRD